MVLNWVKRIYHEMSIRNAVIAVLGNKSDSETMFESEIENMIFNVRQLHENIRPECAMRNCSHLIFYRCSALTGLNLDNILTELGSMIITIAVRDLQVEQLRQDNRRVNDGLKSSQLQSFNSSFEKRRGCC